MKNEKTIIEEKPNPTKESTDLAVSRTVMAADRSLMAWVRTSLSLVSFGFAIYKFLEYSNEQLLASGKVAIAISGPKMIGLFMIGTGILCLLLGSIENVMTIKNLRGKYCIGYIRFTLILSIILFLFSIFIFLGILFRIKGIA